MISQIAYAKVIHGYREHTSGQPFSSVQERTLLLHCRYEVCFRRSEPKASGEERRHMQTGGRMGQEGPE